MSSPLQPQHTPRLCPSVEELFPPLLPWRKRIVLREDDQPRVGDDHRLQQLNRYVVSVEFGEEAVGVEDKGRIDIDGCRRLRCQANSQALYSDDERG